MWRVLTVWTGRLTVWTGWLRCSAAGRQFLDSPNGASWLKTRAGRLWAAETRKQKGDQRKEVGSRPPPLSGAAGLPPRHAPPPVPHGQGAAKGVREGNKNGQEETSAGRTNGPASPPWTSLPSVVSWSGLVRLTVTESMGGLAVDDGLLLAAAGTQAAAAVHGGNEASGKAAAALKRNKRSLADLSAPHDPSLSTFNFSYDWSSPAAFPLHPFFLSATAGSSPTAFPLHLSFSHYNWSFPATVP